MCAKHKEKPFLCVCVWVCACLLVCLFSDEWERERKGNEVAARFVCVFVRSHFLLSFFSSSPHFGPFSDDARFPPSFFSSSSFFCQSGIDVWWSDEGNLTHMKGTPGRKWRRGKVVEKRGRSEATCARGCARVCVCEWVSEWVSEWDWKICEVEKEEKAKREARERPVDSMRENNYEIWVCGRSQDDPVTSQGLTSPKSCLGRMWMSETAQTKNFDTTFVIDIGSPRTSLARYLGQ